MSDTTDQLGVMPGVRDYEVTLPFQRDGETTALKVRVPATGDTAARLLGEVIAEHVSSAPRQAGAAAWRPCITEITAVDVDDTPSPAELAAQVEHWQRIVTAVAGKYPGIVQVSAEEYAAADPTTLQVVSMGNGAIMFATEQALAMLGDRTGPAAMLTDTPTGGPEAEQYGGHPDPDVRDVQVHHLPMLPVGKVELLHEGKWEPIIGTDINSDLTVTVTVVPADEDKYQIRQFDDLKQAVTVRPATVQALGSDLPAAALYGRQILTGDGWWTVASSDYTGPTVQTYNTLLVKNPNRRDALGAVVITGGETMRSTSISARDQVLLRALPPEWWS